MPKILVSQSGRLEGEVKVCGAKNAALPIISAAMLSDEICCINEVPNLDDIKIMCKLLSSLGAKVKFENTSITIDPAGLNNSEAPYELVSKMRASFLVMGPVLAKTGYVKISLPGGCPIGTRPVDLHLKGLSAMGAKITQGHGYVEAKAKKLNGAKIYLDFPSVGATENIIMAAIKADGQTIIENAAIEPEIVDLANFLSKMGSDIKGAGTDTIRINGKDKLTGTTHSVIPDRIEAGTFMVAAAITHGKVKINNVIPGHLKPISAKLRELGVSVEEMDTSVIVDANIRLKSADVKTLPFPGFPTDMQAPFTSLMSIIDGTSIIVETIFENRFLHVPELSRMGAKIKIDGRSAVVEGRKGLTGAQVKASDLRAGAALVLAGLVAKGDTEIGEIEHIDRGYYDLVGKLGSLGAKIKRTE